MELADSSLAYKDDDGTCMSSGSDEESENKPLQCLESESTDKEISPLVNMYNDEISVAVRRGTMGTALYAVLGISTCMALVSLALLLTYVPENEKDDLVDDEEATVPQGDACARALASRTHTPIWAGLMELQINVIQNLFHASLLGSAGMVAAFRGDAVWLYFSRNCAFYFGLPALSYLVVDAVSVSTGSALEGTTTRLGLTLVFSLFTCLAFCKLDSTGRLVRRICVEHSRMQAGTFSSINVGDRSKYPTTLAQNEWQQAMADVTYYSARGVEILAIFYTATTSAQHIIGNDYGTRSLEGIVDDSNDINEKVSILPFEMSYSLGAHQSFLLSLFLLTSTYPMCPASVGGAVLASSWRVVLATSSVIETMSSSRWTDDRRRQSSLAFTTLEAVLMVPIFCAAISLSRNLPSAMRQDNGTPVVEERIERKEVQVTSGYSQVESSDLDELDAEPDAAAPEVEAMDVATLACFKCPSLSQIASSASFSRRKRNGAHLLWAFTVALFVGMTLECVLLLRQHMWDWNMMHEVYKWGMHVAAMYLFCSVMCISSPDVYKKARVLLSLMCPIGSCIAFWQLYILVTNDDDWSGSLTSLSISVLFGVRAICGVGQCVGLFRLTDTVPDSVLYDDDNASKSNRALEAMSKARRALFFLYLPSMIVYAVGVALTGNCSEPMISPTTPSWGGSGKFMLAQNWPGMGLFFHFGLLLIIFASDGISLRPSYKPGLAVASLFSCHIALMLIAALFWGILEHSTKLEMSDWIRVVSTLPWALSSVYLFLCLHWVWNARIVAI